MAFPLVLYNSSVLGAVGCAVSMFCLGVSVQAAIVYFPRRSFGVENSIVDQLIWAQVILVVIWLTSFGFVALLTQLYVTIEAVEKCVRQRTIELSDALSDLRSAQAATEKLSQLKTNFINYVGR
ncbi:hypothetical protein BJ742DRAFT_823226 [Cladochytrium replicatum]|nr:hypothetical protein BJ742DRAFT_823226 [Cladochytrium replicatum]